MSSIVVSDLDGTLLNSANRISARNQRCISELLQAGQIQLVLATGRHYRDIQCLIESFKTPLAAITSNGASVHSFSGELIRSKTLDPITLQAILLVSKKFKVHANIYSESSWWTEKPAPSALRTSVVDEGFQYRHIDSFDQLPEAALKIFFYGEQGQHVELAASLVVLGLININACFSSATLFEITAKGVNKATGLERLLAYEGLDNSNTLAFGDAENDIELLDYVAEAVAIKDSRVAGFSDRGYRVSDVAGDAAIAETLSQKFYTTSAG